MWLNATYIKFYFILYTRVLKSDKVLRRYWLYAAVSSKCLLVTNDEMRDHLFNLLGNSFFPRWKEKHQVFMILGISFF